MQLKPTNHCVRNTSPAPGLIMFDWDGVLADTRELFTATFLKACRRCGVHGLDAPGSLMSLFDGNMYDSLKTLGLERGRIETILEDFRRGSVHLADDIRLFAGVPEMLTTLAGNHTLAVITSNLAAIIVKVLDREGIRGVDRVLGVEADTSKTRKIRQTMAAFPGRPAFYVGDTKGDMLEGRAAGALTVAVSWGWHTLEKLNEARPDFSVHSPAELPERLRTAVEGGPSGR